MQCPPTLMPDQPPAPQPLVMWRQGVGWVTVSNRDLLLDPAVGKREGLPSLSSLQLASMLDEAPALAQEMLVDPDEQTDALLVYRAVSAVLAESLLRADAPLFSRGVSRLLAIYRLGDFSADLRTRTPDFEASLWESIAIELFALGGLAVAREMWPQVRELTLQVPNPDSAAAYDRSWLRHGQVASARSAQDPTDSLPQLAATRLGELLPTPDVDLLALVCRFDLLAALVVTENGGEYYPNAAPFSETLVEPFIIDQLRRVNTPVRASVFAGDDERLRAGLRSYNEDAVVEAANHRAGGRRWEWRGWSNARTWFFIRTGDQWERWQLGG